MKTLIKLSIILSIVGISDALYLYLSKFDSIKLMCGVSSCDIVNASKYAYFLNIPNSLLGILFYSMILVCIVLNKYKYYFYLSTIGIIYSIYLTFLEAFVIHAFCQWCLLSAWISLCLFIISVRIIFTNR